MQKAQTKPSQAYLYQAYCNISMVVAQLLLKQLSAYFYIPLLLGLRASVLFLFNYIRLSWDGHSMMVSDSVLKAIIQRSLVSSTVVMTYLIPIMYIPISVANTLFNVSPIIMFFVEVYLFKKGRMHLRQLLLTVLCFVGVVCIIQPEFLFSHSSIPAEQLPFYFMALCAAFFSAFSLILLHNLRDKCDKQVALQYNYIFQAVVAYSIFLLNPSADHHPPSLHSWAQLSKILLLLLLLCIFSYLVHIFRIMAIYLIVPSKVAFLGYLTVVLSMLVDVLVFDSEINMVMGIGILLTSVGLIANTLIPKQ